MININTLKNIAKRSRHYSKDVAVMFERTWIVSPSFLSTAAEVSSHEDSMARILIEGLKLTIYFTPFRIIKSPFLILFSSACPLFISST